MRRTHKSQPTIMELMKILAGAILTLAFLALAGRLVVTAQNVGEYKGIWVAVGLIGVAALVVLGKAYDAISVWHKRRNFRS